MTEQLRLFFNHQKVPSVFRASRIVLLPVWHRCVLNQKGNYGTFSHSWPSQEGYNGPSFPASPAVTDLWVCLKGRARTGTFHPQQGGCFMIWWDCRREPPIPAVAPLSRQNPWAWERERVRSARQLQHLNPSWAQSFSRLSLPCSWKTPPFEMLTSTVITDGRGGCIFYDGWLVQGKSIFRQILLFQRHNYLTQK